MIRLSILAAAAIVVAFPAFGQTTCKSEREINQLAKANGLHRYGEMSLDGGIAEIAYINSGTSKYLSVKQKGNCFFDAAFLSKDQYEERFQFEGEGEDDAGADIAVVAPFTDYPVKNVYSGKTRLPDFAGRDKKFYSYRTRIKDGLQAGPNYAGEWSVIQFGCGTSCSVVYIASNRTGQVFDFPFSGEEYGPTTLKHTAESRLLMMTRRDGSNCVMEAMTFETSAWKRIATTRVGSADACYDTFDENFQRYQKATGKAAAKDDAPIVNTEPIAPVETLQAQRPTSPQSLSTPPEGEIGKLKEAYQAYMLLRTCHDLRTGSIPTYINSTQIERAKQAASKIEKEALQRQPSLDKDAIWSAAEAEMKMPLGMMASGAGRYTTAVQQACDSTFADMMRWSGATGGPIKKDF